MNITIHIERLVLEGLPVTSHDARVVQAAVEEQLAQLFSRPDTIPEFQVTSAGSLLRSGSIQMSPDSGPVRTGEQIARAIHSAVWESGSIRNKRGMSSPGSNKGAEPMRTVPLNNKGSLR